MSKIKGKISVDVIDTQTVNIDIEVLTGRLVGAIINSLESYYIYGEKPYLDTDSGESSVEITLYNIDDNITIEDEVNFHTLVDNEIHDLAKESINPTE